MKFIIVIFLFFVKLSTYGQLSELNENYILAQKLFKSGRYNEAIEKFDYCYKIKKDPTLAFWLSYSYAVIGEEKESRKYFEIAYKHENVLKSDYRNILLKIKKWLKMNEDENTKEIELSGFINGTWVDSCYKDTIFYHYIDSTKINK